jgi:hypothetical protein
MDGQERALYQWHRLRPRSQAHHFTGARVDKDRGAARQEDGATFFFFFSLWASI